MKDTAIGVMAGFAIFVAGFSWGLYAHANWPDGPFGKSGHVGEYADAIPSPPPLTIEAKTTYGLSSEYTHCYAEGFTSDHTGVVNGYVILDLYSRDEKPLTVRLHDSRAEELINTLTKARADVAKLMEEK